MFVFPKREINDVVVVGVVVILFLRGYYFFKSVFRNAVSSKQ